MEPEKILEIIPITPLLFFFALLFYLLENQKKPVHLHFIKIKSFFNKNKINK